MEELTKEINRRWSTDHYVETGLPLPQVNFPDFAWVRYEEYMKAQLLKAIPGEVGDLVIRFPPDGEEDNRLANRRVAATLQEYENQCTEN